MGKPLTIQEQLKSVAYAAISQKRAIDAGGQNYKTGKEIVDRWVSDFPVNIKDYFKGGNYKVEDCERVGKELATEAWEALEFFNII